MVQQLLYLALAGALGTVSRFGMSKLVHHFMGHSFPWGTLIVNATGCFMAGLLLTLLEQRRPMATEIRLLLMVGFMGAFTTYSSLIVDTREIFRVASWMPAVGNMMLQNGVGVITLMAGIFLGRSI